MGVKGEREETKQKMESERGCKTKTAREWENGKKGGREEDWGRR